ncbi:unnamed protein product [Caenorhabditis sp. 36 PRJEB53466]|nr:unnamed protein product [Caenorhabditis sp. 36 PRJEB53466]
MSDEIVKKPAVPMTAWTEMRIDEVETIDKKIGRKWSYIKKKLEKFEKEKREKEKETKASEENESMDGESEQDEKDQISSPSPLARRLKQKRLEEGENRGSLLHRRRRQPQK